MAQLRVPPHSIEAEQAVLGGLMLAPEAYDRINDKLTANDFYRRDHQLIYRAIAELAEKNRPFDAVTLGEWFESQGHMDLVAGGAYLVELASTTPSAANIAAYAEIVRDKAVLRRLVNASIRIAQLGYQGQGEVDKIVDEAQQTLFEVTEKKASEDYKSLRELIEPTFDEMEAIASSGDALSGVPTGFVDLDRITNGLHAGQMIIVAARPGVGKSTFALDVCRSAAIHHNLTAAFFSLEMSRTEIVMKILSAEASVPLGKIRGGKMDENDWQRVTDKSAILGEKNLFIDDSPNLTMMEIRAKARRLKQRHDLQLLAIDYIQLMSSGKKVESRQLEVSEFSRQIKLLAKELEIPVIALSQLSRNTEQRKDGIPQLSDLRESGSLEQDADIVLMIHRPEMYSQNPTDEERGLAAFHIPKHRNGETGKIDALFQGHYSRFTNAPM